MTMYENLGWQKKGPKTSWILNSQSEDVTSKKKVEAKTSHGSSDLEIWCGSNSFQVRMRHCLTAMGSGIFSGERLTVGRPVGKVPAVLKRCRWSRPHVGDIGDIGGTAETKETKMLDRSA